MLLKIFTIHDAKAQAYLPPFYLQNVAVAMREFTDACNNPLHNFGKNPQDYTIFILGDFDDQDSLFDLIDKQSLANGLDLVASEYKLKEA